MNRFVLARRAENDLEEILSYLSDKNPKAADDLLDRFEQVFQMLANSPGLGHSRADITKRKLRFWPVDSFLVIYREADVLEIARVLSGYRNLFKLL